MAPKITAADLFVTQNLKTNSTKLHRPTCKRVNTEAAHTVAELISAGRSGVLVDATAAACCKPSGDMAAEVRGMALLVGQAQQAATTEAIEVLEEIVLPTHEAPAEEPEAAPADDPTEEPVEAQDDPTEAPTTTQSIAFAATKMAKHYRSRFGRVGGKLITDALGVDAKITNSLATLKGEPELVEHAVRVLYKTWDDGYEVFLNWRKASAAYKGTLAAEKGSPWFKSNRAALELQWLEDFCEGVAAVLADQAIDPDEAQAEGFSHGVAFATRSFLL